MEEERQIILRPDQRFRTNPDYIFREIGGECVLVPVGQGGPFENSMITLNETSAFLWKQFMNGCALGDVIKAAKAEYEDDSDGEEMTRNIVQYVAESLQFGLLVEE